MQDNRFTQIKDISQIRRMPLLGKIRLGIKKKSVNTDKEYPAETDYFVFDKTIRPEYLRKITELYGDKPKEIDVFIPVEDRAKVFPQAYRYYGSSKGLKCIGNGEQAMEWSDDKKSMVERNCPCEKLTPDAKGRKQCSRRAFLMVILPKVSMGGVFQLSTSSFNSIVDINSGLDYVDALIDRISMVPLKLSRVVTETHFDGKKQTHYTLKILFDGSAEFINQLKDNTKRILLEERHLALPAPKYENPELDEPDVIDAEVEQTNGQVPEPAEDEAQDEKPVEADSQIEQPKNDPPRTDAQAKMIHTLCGKLKINDEIRRKLLFHYYKKQSSKDITIQEAGDFINHLLAQQNGACDLTITPDGEPYFEYPV